MRPLLLILLLANLILFAGQFDVIRDFIRSDRPATRPEQINAERLRIIRDTSGRPYAVVKSAPERGPVDVQPASGTNN